MVQSADGRGRTLLEILMGWNKRDMTPLELQYHNPLKARVGNSIIFDHDLELKDINFFIEAIEVYKTAVVTDGKSQDYFDTDYVLRGIARDMKKPMRLRLRLSPDPDSTEDVGHKLILFRLYDEMAWDQDFHDKVLGDPTMEFHVNYDDAGAQLADPWTYWRIDDVPTPYEAKVTILKDKDHDGVVEDDELARRNCTYWDYSRIANGDKPENEQFLEYLTIEMNDRHFTFYRGREIKSFQVTII